MGATLRLALNKQSTAISICTFSEFYIKQFTDLYSLFDMHRRIFSAIRIKTIGNVSQNVWLLLTTLSRKIRLLLWFRYNRHKALTDETTALTNLNYQQTHFVMSAPIFATYLPIPELKWLLQAVPSR